MSSKDAVRAAVVGYGFSGRCFHSYLIGLTPSMQLAGVVSRDATTRERIVAERGCIAYESFEQALDDPDVDLIVLATPNATHTDLAIRALFAGKHVVTDKVMCLSLSECDRMMAAAQRNGRFLSVFHNRRWDGDFMTLSRLMTSGDLGDVHWVEMAWQGFGPWGGWRGKAEMGGGRFWDLGAHLVDQAALLFPSRVERVWCRTHHEFLPDSDVDSECVIVVTFLGGSTAVIDLSSNTAFRKPRFLAHGSLATFVKVGLDPQERAMMAGAIDSAVESPENYARIIPRGGEERVEPTLPGRWRSYYENVADVLLKGAAPAVPMASVRRAVGILDAAHRSARTGEAIRPDS